MNSDIISWISEDLRNSGISMELAQAAGINGREIQGEKYKEILGFDKFAGESLQSTCSGYEIPYKVTSGENGTRFSRVKLKHRLGDAKYLSPKKGHVCHPSHLYIVFNQKTYLTSSKKPLIIVEGEKKALSVIQYFINNDLLDQYCVVGISGITMWFDAPEWKELKIRISGRDCFICFDADGIQNPDVRREELKLYAWLTAQGGNVRSLLWPENRGKGIDDYLIGAGI